MHRWKSNVKCSRRERFCFTFFSFTLACAHFNAVPYLFHPIPHPRSANFNSTLRNGANFFPSVFSDFEFRDLTLVVARNTKIQCCNLFFLHFSFSKGIRLKCIFSCWQSSLRNECSQLCLFTLVKCWREFLKFFSCERNKKMVKNR